MTVYAGDASVSLYAYDLRTLRKVGTLKGATGSIRSQCMSRDGANLVISGLDRYVRLFDTSAHNGKGSDSASVYCKNRINSLLLAD